jgi:hypothetical protein
MNILSNFLNQYRVKGKVDLPKRELLLFAVSAIREAERIEHDNTGSAGKAAIEFLLNMKYEIVENRQLQEHTKDLLLGEIDSVIAKLCAKYRVQRKGKQFIFSESLAITEPAIIGPVGSDLLADLYAANTELETLRIQLARTSLNSSDCFRLKSAILDKEKQIKDIKIAITKQKYFSHTDDQNSYNPIYRRSLGEEAKDAAKNGAIAGGIAGTVIGKHKGVVDNRHKQAVNQFKKANDFLNTTQSKAEKEYFNYASAKDLTKANKDTLKRAGHTKQSAQETMNAARQALKKLSKDKAIANKYKAQATKRLQKSGVKVLGSAIKGGAKGALIGAAAGLAAYGAKKIADKKHESLVEQLEKHIEQTRRK